MRRSSETHSLAQGKITTQLRLRISLRSDNSIHNIIRRDISRIIGCHIQCHHGDYCVYYQLDWWGQRNVDMHLLAKSLMYTRRQQQHNNKLIGISKAEGFAVIVHKVKISGNYVKLIHDLIQGNRLLKYWN